MHKNQILQDNSARELEKDISDLVGKYPMIILLRHAERFEIMAGKSGSMVQLTEDGKSTSRKLGKKLFNNKIEAIYSSPIQRCLDTAKNILDGADQTPIPIVKDTILGDPGCFVIDSKTCGAYFATHGTTATVLEYLKVKDLPGFRNLEKGATIMKDFLIQNISSTNNKINLAISHDAIIMAFIANFIDWEFSEENWHNYLEGIVLFTKLGEFFLRYKGITQKIVVG